MRKLLDDLGIRCYSTHNESSYMSQGKNSPGARHEPDLGTKYVVMAWSDPKGKLDAWKEVADR